MARTSWFDDKAEHPAIQERVSKLESFTSALADGVVSRQELAGQEQRLVAAMKKVEGDLSDDVHGKVTDVLIELTAYNIMRLLRYSVELYAKLEAETGQPVDWHACGSVRLATTADRLDEFRHRQAMGEVAGVPIEIVGPDLDTVASVSGSATTRTQIAAALTSAE